MKLTALFFVFLILSCDLLTQSGGTIPDDKHFKMDMNVTVNGQSGYGIMVVPKADEYRIDLNFSDGMELVKLATCHREYTVEKTGWSGAKSHSFAYIAATGIENQDYCPILIGAFDKNGQHAWAMIEIRDLNDLTAQLFCNGSDNYEVGVSICQSRAGLQQRITFSSQVKFEQLGDCGEIRTKDNLTFDFLLGTGTCTYLFKNQFMDTFHRLTVYGYNDVILKGISPENQWPKE